MKLLILFLSIIGLAGLIVVNKLNSQTQTGLTHIFQTGKIAFSITPPGDDNEIYTINADRTGLRQLASHEGRDAGPAWSPDASKIAFYTHSTTESWWSIFVMDSSGDNIQRLTDTEDVWDSSPSWSPDGTQIAFSREYPLQNFRSEIWVMNADSGGNQHMIDSLAGMQEWSPDGNQFVFISDRDGDSEIYKMNISGTNVQQLTFNNSEEWWPDWSPDGEKIAFMSDQDGNFEIYVVDSAGNNQERLTENNAEDWRPDWSPDGMHIAFVSMRDGNYEIYIMKANGEDQTRLTFTNGHAIQPDWRPTDISGFGDPEKEIITPIAFKLFQNYPNPFNPTTQISFSIPQLIFVNLKVYDALGNEIMSLVNEEKPAGEYEVEFDGRELTSGIYFYRLKAGNHLETKKMLLLK